MNFYEFVSQNMCGLLCLAAIIAWVIVSVKVTVSSRDDAGDE